MPSTNEQVGIILSELSEMFKEELSQGRINGYIEVLRYYDYDKLQYAVKEIIRERSSHWFPLPKEIIDIIHDGPKPSYKALPELESTPKDLEYGKYQCRFAASLIRRNRIKQAEDPKRRAEMWLQFLNEQQAPDWLIKEAKADMPVFEVEK